MDYKRIEERMKAFRADVLNELEAEVVGQQIPYHKIFTVDGKNISKEELKPEWAAAFKEILAAIKKQGLTQKFSPDKGELDIVPGAKNIFRLNADDGTKYIYNMAKKQLTAVAQ